MGKLRAKGKELKKYLNSEFFTISNIKKTTSSVEDAQAKFAGKFNGPSK